MSLPSEPSTRDSLRVAFIHPDLGIGGSERLVVKAALHLQRSSHKVTLFTACHDATRSFEETRGGVLDIRVAGGFLPAHLGQRLRAACTIARMSYLICAMALRGERFDIIFCDLVPHVIPLLRLFNRARIVLYCHYPDVLLTPPRHFCYQLYRMPIDLLEEIGMRAADRVLVNSHFTASEFRRAFPRLNELPIGVLHPGIDAVCYERSEEERGFGPSNGETLTILSVNRFEPKKNLGLAIEALALLRARISEQTFKHVKLIMAGGFDSRLKEDRETLGELQALARRLRLQGQVVFILSCTDTERATLLSRCLCFVYTPKNEHFGLGLLEAMAAGKPVIAVGSGGPLETVRHEETGLLCHPTPQAFADALASLILDPNRCARMGQAGREHVAKRFSLSAFGSRLETILQELVAEKRKGAKELEGKAFFFGRRKP
jgi:alpha-1,3/alpha-1,6-mannosyltransferase